MPEANSPAATPIETPKTPEAFFARARKLSDLEAAGVPFHLKATFVATGDTEFTGSGTFEEWWQSKNVWRKEATLGNYKYVAVQNGTAKAASATSAYTPLRVRQVEGLQIFDIAPPKEKKPPKWKITHMNLNGVPLTVIGTQGPCDPHDHELRCPTEYSFTDDGLLWGFRYIQRYEAYSDFQPFGNLQFPGKITLALRGKRLLEVQIATLEKLSKGESSRFDPNSLPNLGAKPSLLVELENGVSQRGATPPKLLHARRPKYPESEKKSLSEGTVVIQITVDAKGAVREPFVQLSHGKAFDQAAMKAVRAYRFQPAMKDHQPAMTDVAVVVKFRIF